MPDRDWWQELWPNPQAMMRELGVRPGARAIDICCGDGYFTVPLAQLEGLVLPDHCEVASSG